jgi:hypothetical protein
MKLDSLAHESIDYDPLDLPPAQPRITRAWFEEDEIHPEARELIDELKQARSGLEVHSIIWNKAIEYYEQGFSAD